MATTEKQLTEKESLDLITKMIHTAKNSYHDTGVGAMMWGIVIAICSLVKLSEIHFGYRLPFDIYLLTLVAVIPQIYLTVREKKLRKVKTYDDNYMDYIWLAFGICIFLMIFIINHVFAELEPMQQEYRELLNGKKPAAYFRFNEYISPLFLLLYGMPTFITGAACKFRPMLWGGLFCWACSILSLYTTVKIDLLLTAASALLAWFVPGLVMEKEYRRYKKEQETLHV